MRKINVDFSVWEGKTGHGTNRIGSIPAQIIRDADEPLYLDDSTGMIYAPVMTRELFEEFFGRVIQEEKK